jgi:hypothetical protein
MEVATINVSLEVEPGGEYGDQPADQAGYVCGHAFPDEERQDDQNRQQGEKN